MDGNSRTCCAGQLSMAERVQRAGRAPCLRPCLGPTDEVGQRLDRVTGVAFLHRPPDLARPKRLEWLSSTMQLVVQSRPVDTRSAAISPNNWRPGDGGWTMSL